MNQWLSCCSRVVVLALTFSGVASAQVDAERFKPAVTVDGWVNAEGSGTRSSDDPWEFGLFLNYAHNPLVVVDGDGDVTRQFVAGRMGIDVLASVSLADPFAIGIDVPIFVLQHGDDDPSFAGLGDVRVVPKLRLLDDRTDGIGLALIGEVRAPTHTGDFSGGARNVTFVPKAVLDHRFRNGIRLGFNAGAVIREGTTFANVRAGSELAYAAALGYRIGGAYGRTELGVELNGGAGLVQTDDEELPLEALAFVRHEPAQDWEIIGGPGIGVVPGYGVPTFRVFAGVRFHPTAHDADGDGISDADDQCPTDAEDRDGDMDGDGCPEEDPDTDHDGVPDYSDECPDAKETINGVEDEDGCPDSGSARVVYEDGKFVVLDKIQFEHGSADIKAESHSVLDQMALTIKANPQFKRVRVEGHTDDTGPREINMQLSERRARSVRQYLIGRGVSARRLSAEGFGPDRPLADGRSDAARAKNRRVEFVVED
jgi:outer membrane protein OmpA-like peptidoglycan-associated protein